LNETVPTAVRATAALGHHLKSSATDKPFV
jgi:hypothetical protein